MSKNTTGPEFFKMGEWLKAQPQPIRMTSRQLNEGLAKILGRRVPKGTVDRLIEATEVVIEDPRRNNLAGRDRSKRLAGVISLILADLDNLLGYKPGQAVTDELVALLHGKSTSLNAEDLEP